MLLIGLVLRPLGALVGDGQQGLGHLAAMRVEVGAHRLVLGHGGLVNRIQSVAEIIQHVVDYLGDEAGLDRLDDGIGRLDRDTRQALGGNLLLDEALAIGDHLGADSGASQDVLQRAHGRAL